MKILISAALTWLAAAPAQAATMAIAELEYVDTSGEAKDQSADHQRRMALFAAALRRDLEAAGFRFVAIKCDGGPCGSGDNPVTIQAAARAAGAKYVFLGGVHKMSTLLQWGKFQIVDEEAGRIALDRLITFRGDTDEAFARAEAFMAKEILDPAKGIVAAK